VIKISNITDIVKHQIKNNVKTHNKKNQLKLIKDNVTESIKNKNNISIKKEIISPYQAYYILSKIKKEHKNNYLEKDINDSINLKSIKEDYTLVLTDNSIDNPYIISSELVKIIREHTKKCNTKEEIAKCIFNWMEQKISYGDDLRTMRRVGYKNTKEVIIDGEGICGEMAYLYITMTRCCGLKSSFAHVKKDYKGKKVRHACVYVELDNKNILVDPAYHTYNINHQRYRVLSDNEVLGLFNAWRNN
jgi:hypothetical protein